jgi:hypothetical protein
MVESMFVNSREKMSSFFRRSQNLEKKRQDLAAIVVQYDEKNRQSSSQSPTSSGSSRPQTSTAKLFKRKSQALETTPAIEQPVEEPNEPLPIYDVAIIGAGPGGLMLAYVDLGSLQDL